MNAYAIGFVHSRILGYYGSRQRYLKLTATVGYGTIMRQYILTEREREEIRRYLKDRKITDLISVLRVRAKKYLKRLKSDVKLLEEVVSK